MRLEKYSSYVTAMYVAVPTCRLCFSALSQKPRSARPDSSVLIAPFPMPRSLSAPSVDSTYRDSAHDRFFPQW